MGFMFAYLLMEYERVCVVESDLVVMKEMNSVFSLPTPSILKYDSEQKTLYNVSKKELREKYVSGSAVNGGVMLFEPSIEKFNECTEGAREAVRLGCSWPNEYLFLFANPSFYSLPYAFNMIHYHVDSNMKSFKIQLKDIHVMHYSYTKYKPLDVVRDGYLPVMLSDRRKYGVRIDPIIYFRDKVYNIHKDQLERKMKRIVAGIERGACTSKKINKSRKVDRLYKSTNYLSRSML
jgi:hypothetical protein